MGNLRIQEATALSLFSDTHIRHRIGEDTKCDSYCPVSDFCPFARARKSDV